MIKLVQNGLYILIQKETQEKILLLNRFEAYQWMESKEFSQLSVTRYEPDPSDTTLHQGKYRFYHTRDDMRFTDGFHLELCRDSTNNWEGYILSQGLPIVPVEKSYITPANEIITESIHPLLLALL